MGNANIYFIFPRLNTVLQKLISDSVKDYWYLNSGYAGLLLHVGVGASGWGSPVPNFVTNNECVLQLG